MDIRVNGHRRSPDLISRRQPDDDSMTAEFSPTNRSIGLVSAVQGEDDLSIRIGCR